MKPNGSNMKKDKEIPFTKGLLKALSESINHAGSKGDSAWDDAIANKKAIDKLEERISKLENKKPCWICKLFS